MAYIRRVLTIQAPPQKFCDYLTDIGSHAGPIIDRGLARLRERLEVGSA